MKKKLIYLTLILLGALCFSENALAENQDLPQGFSVSPFFQEVNLEKNQMQKDFTLEITNNTQTSAMLKLAVVDFGALNESGGVAFLGSAEDLKNKYALASWVSLEKDALAINAGEKQSVKVTIQNKDSLSPGGHYAAVMANMAIDDNGTGSESSIVALDPSFASLVFVRKVGGETYGLNLNNLEIKNDFFSLSSVTRLRFQNTGNVHVTPRGLVKIIDPMGREIMRGIINGESAIILPETFRIYPTSIQKTSLAFMPGKYKLVTEYRYDGKDEFTSKQKEFYFVPVFAVLVCLALVGIVIALMASLYGKYKKKIAYE